MTTSLEGGGASAQRAQAPEGGGVEGPSTVVYKGSIMGVGSACEPGQVRWNNRGLGKFVACGWRVGEAGGGSWLWSWCRLHTT